MGLRLNWRMCSLIPVGPSRWQTAALPEDHWGAGPLWGPLRCFASLLPRTIGVPSPAARGSMRRGEERNNNNIRYFCRTRIPPT